MLKSLFIDRFRNLNNVELDLGAGCTWFVGGNGAGKSSLLEAINLLLSTKSFRTNKAKVFIQQDQNDCLVRGRLVTVDRSEQSIAVLKRRSGGTTFRYNGEDIGAGEFVQNTPPLQILAPEAPLLVDSAAQERRRFLDWGVFHVKHDFLEIWRLFSRLLKQRNVVLKAKEFDRLLLASIDQQWFRIAKKLHEERLNHWQTFLKFLSNGPTAELLDILNLNNEGQTFRDLQLKYKSGWSGDNSLEDTIRENLSNDCRLGFTQLGPHRCDLQILFDERPAKDVLSRGQKKILQFWLKLHQSSFLFSEKARKTVFLVDDICAELDSERSRWVFDYLNRISDQIFYTTTNTTGINHMMIETSAMFHVKHGAVYSSKKEAT